MIVFLYGRDNYRLKQNLDKIVAEYRKKSSGMSLAILDLGPDVLESTRQQLEKLTDLVRTVSFFDEKRLIVLRNAFATGKETVNLVKNWGLGTDKQIILVFAENTDKGELLKKNKELFHLLSAKPNITKSFEPLTGKQLENWAQKEIETLGGKIEPLALKKLISYVASPPTRNEPPDPSSTWGLKQEINKLTNYKLAANGSPIGNKAIGISDVELLVGPNATLNIFEVIDALAGKNKPKAAALLYNHLEQGVDPYYIFSMIIYQFRNLLRIKSLAKNAVPYTVMVKKTGLHPYVVKKTYEQCKKFDLNELEQLFSKLAQLDISAKSGNVDMAEGLYQFAFSLGL